MAVIDQVIENMYALYNGDSCEVMKKIPNDSIDFSIFSPPFADLYCYSDDPRDLANCRDYSEFFSHFGIIVDHLSRVIKPGRICAVHCIDIPIMKERDGYIGLRDFPGDIIRRFQDAGFIYHSRTVIWKDPLIEATRTKALGLAHKQICKDSAMSRMGLPDYLIAFRVPGENTNPVSHECGLSEYIGSKDPGGVGVKRSHNIWREYASPVWMDIRQTNTLNATNAREENDEKHICPLQLDIIGRALTLWTNPNDIVLTPFAGVGSEVYSAILFGRRGIGIELKSSYYQQAVANCRYASNNLQQSCLFSDDDA